MIKVEHTAQGVSCEMEGELFDLLAETAIVVESAAENFQKSTKCPMTFETALQHTISAIYEAITENRRTS